MIRSSRTGSWQSVFRVVLADWQANGSKAYRELRDGATQSKLRFESRLGAE
ncbi:hypothetical protein L1N85_12195 [Paenibacillus alkaliterrae]|uniref:hypothetical protein n=1 Tax=Paenibacillus alkaliterrae TaxID=320909 RepID=UPI001F19A8E9|nr:hypothetical protein [Paenibacillus alkaliterrae]MCF2939194.1 hypothetical protein [Paenibacillus alkaliterrae]